MAYSRWGKYSEWYTFWSKTPESETRFKLPTQELKNKQTFEICDFPSYYITYGEIKKKGFKKILKNVEEFYGKKHKVSVLGKETKIKPMKPTKKQLTELYKYLELFVEDVNEEFGWYNFFVYNWIIPFKWKLQNLFKK